MSELHGEVFRALGFQPIAADIKRFVAEIAGDSFDAHDNPLTNIYTFGVHRHHRHITLTSHFFGASFFICNARAYAEWPADVRAAVDEAAPEAIALQRRLAASEDADVLAKLDPRENEVVHLTAAEHAAFVAAAEPVLAKYRGQLDPRLFALLEPREPQDAAGVVRAAARPGAGAPACEASNTRLPRRPRRSIQ